MSYMRRLLSTHQTTFGPHYLSLNVAIPARPVPRGDGVSVFMCVGVQWVTILDEVSSPHRGVLPKYLKPLLAPSIHYGVINIALGRKFTCKIIAFAHHTHPS